VKGSDDTADRDVTCPVAVEARTPTERPRAEGDVQPRDDLVDRDHPVVVAVADAQLCGAGDRCVGSDRSAR